MTTARTYMSRSLYSNHQLSLATSTPHPVYGSVLSTTPRRSLWSSGWRRFSNPSKRAGSDRWEKSFQELERVKEQLRRNSRHHKAAVIEEWNRLLSSDPHGAIFGDSKHVWAPWTRHKPQTGRDQVMPDDSEAVNGEKQIESTNSSMLRHEYEQVDKELDTLEREFDKAFYVHDKDSSIDPITNRRISKDGRSHSIEDPESTKIYVKKFEPSHPTDQLNKPATPPSEPLSMNNVSLRGFAAQPWLSREGFTASLATEPNHSDTLFGQVPDPWADVKLSALRKRARQLQKDKHALETKIAETASESARLRQEQQRQESAVIKSNKPRYEMKFAENTADKDLDQLTAKQLRAQMGQKPLSQKAATLSFEASQPADDARQKRIDFLKRSEIPGMQNLSPFLPPVIKTHNPYAVSADACALNASLKSKMEPRYSVELQRKLDAIDERERNTIKSEMAAFEAKYQPRTTSTGDVSTTRPFGWKFDPAKEAIKKEAALVQAKKDAALVKEIKDIYEGHYGAITVNHRQVPQANSQAQDLQDYDARQSNAKTKQAKLDESLRHYDKFSGQPEALPRLSKSAHSSLQSALGEYDSAELAKTSLERSLAAYDNSLNKVTRTLQEGKKRTTEVKDALEEYDRRVLQTPRQFKEEDWDSIIMPTESQQKPMVDPKSAMPSVEKLEPALTRQAVLGSSAKPSQPTASLPASQGTPEIRYSYIALTYQSGKLQVAHSSSTCVDHKPNLSVGTILSRLRDPTGYFEKMAELDQDGYELVGGSRSMLVFRRALTGSELAFNVNKPVKPSPPSPLSSNPTTTPKQPDGSQTVRRAEEVFSGSAANAAGSTPVGPPPPSSFGSWSSTRAFRRFKAMRRRWGFFKRSAFFFLVVYLGYKASVFFHEIYVSAREAIHEKRMLRQARMRHLETFNNRPTGISQSDDAMTPRIQVRSMPPHPGREINFFDAGGNAQLPAPGVEVSASYSPSSDDRSLADTIIDYQARAHADLVRRAREWHESVTKDKLGNDGSDREKHTKRHISIHDASKQNQRDEDKKHETGWSFSWKWPQDKHEGESERRNQ